jgi:hypothetical protein
VLVVGSTGFLERKSFVSWCTPGRCKSIGAFYVRQLKSKRAPGNGPGDLKNAASIKKTFCDGFYAETASGT